MTMIALDGVSDPELLRFAVILLSACAFFFSMGLVSLFFFNVDDVQARRGKRFISIVGATAMGTTIAAFLQESDWPLWSTVVALTFYAYALLMFWWTYLTNRSTPFDFAFSGRSPMGLTRAGPYNAIRHPFYSSYIAGWLAGAIAAPNLATLTVFLLMTSVYVTAAFREEAAFRRSELCDDYAEFAAETGLFWPSASGVMRILAQVPR
ncbi:methyltransferase [Variovorax sp. J2P1-59]|uniref:methyltransferase family protein n=1 Tax=Variovorax flavidus TaxID=3053501 RepID=UPI0025760AB6|nr:methyltransferase [Variovorax sp. J2P1-59]MDM0078795.1 methyltransferase [Variovorax sp. J2P1-59]